MTAFTYSKGADGTDKWFEVTAVYYKSAAGTWVECKEGWYYDGAVKTWRQWWPHGSPGPVPKDWQVTTFMGKKPDGSILGPTLQRPIGAAWSQGGIYAFLTDAGSGGIEPGVIHRWSKTDNSYVIYAGQTASTQCTGSSSHGLNGSQASLSEAVMRYISAIKFNAANDMFVSVKGQILFFPGPNTNFTIPQLDYRIDTASDQGQTVTFFTTPKPVVPFTAYTLTGGDSGLAGKFDNVYIGGKYVKRFAGFGYANTTQEGYVNGTGGQEGTSRLGWDRYNTGAGFALDEVNKCLYYADTGNQCVRKVSTDPLTWGYSTTLAGPLPGSVQGGYVDSPDSTLARFFTPNDCAIWGNWVLVADKNNSALRGVRIAAGDDGWGQQGGQAIGEVITFMGSKSTAFKQLSLRNSTSSVEVSADNSTVYVGDGTRIIALDMATKTASLFTGSTTAGNVNGALVDARFSSLGFFDLRVQGGEFVVPEVGNSAGRLISNL